jgi:hypothetical protein
MDVATHTVNCNVVSWDAYIFGLNIFYPLFVTVKRGHNRVVQGVRICFVDFNSKCTRFLIKLRIAETRKRDGWNDICRVVCFVFSQLAVAVKTIHENVFVVPSICFNVKWRSCHSRWSVSCRFEFRFVFFTVLNCRIKIKIIK